MILQAEKRTSSDFRIIIIIITIIIIQPHSLMNML